MATWTFGFGADPGSGPVTFRDADNAVWIATTGGTIVSLRLLDGTVRTHGGGYVEPLAALPAVDGLGVFIVEAAGRILHVYREEADAENAVVLVDLMQQVATARLSSDGSTLFIASNNADGTLTRVDTQSGEATQLVSNLISEGQAIVDIAIDEANNRAILLRSGDQEQHLLFVDLEALTNEPVALETPVNAATIMIAPDSLGAGLIVAGADGELARVDFDGQLGEPGPNLGIPVRGLTRWQALILISSDESIVAQEWNIDEGILRFPTLAPAFIGGYVPVLIDLAAAAISPDDLDLTVEEGPEGGSVSVGIEAPDDEGRSRYLVLAGIRTGEFHLLARHKVDGAFLGRGSFRVQATWPDEMTGPPIVITGEQRNYAFGNWGGGPPVVQNINVRPAPENYRVALVLVETKDRGFGPDPSATRNTWRERLIGPNSTKTFYEESSLRNTPAGAFVKGTTITLVDNRVFGPVVMPDGWGDYFKDREKPWLGWLSKPDARQAMATAFSESLMDAGISDAILRQTDAVVFIVRTASDEPGKVGTKDFTAKFAWPEARGARFNYKTEFATSQRTLPIVLTPDDYPTGMPMPRRFPWIAMLAHELGHTLGLEDLYDANEQFPAEVDARAVGAMDLMGDGWPHPDFSLPNRMRLGWIDPAWIERIDFATSPNGRTVLLQASSAFARSGLPAGRKAGIEVRIRDGWNYYFEYRRTRAGNMSDQQLNLFGASSLIAGLDVMSSGKPEAARPVIEFIPVDPDNDGPVLNSIGDDFEDSDLTNPEGMHDFRLVFDQIVPADNNAARVRIEYVRARRPELQITPAPGNGDWKSPDIDIESKFGRNKVAKGMPNKVIVKVHNAGVRAATAVRVRVKWLQFTPSSGGAWQELPEPPRLDLLPGQQKEFVTNWDLPASVKIGDVEVNHFCIRADIDRYVDPTDPAQNEIVIHNNWAQSNFDMNSVGSGSPPDRVRTGLSMTNGLTRPATYLLDVIQDSQHFRVFIGNAWLQLEPDESRMVELAYESLAGDPIHGRKFDEEFAERGLRDINRVSVSSFVLPADAMVCRSPRLWWGVNLALSAGWRTRIGRITRTGELIRGFVESDAGGGRHGVSQGKVTLALWLDDHFDHRHELSANLEANGRFSIVIPGDLLAEFGQIRRIECEALYLGTQRYVPCRSRRQRLRD
jgi:M6 family metalloprotease-like protein